MTARPDPLSVALAVAASLLLAWMAATTSGDIDRPATSPDPMTYEKESTP